MNFSTHIHTNYSPCAVTTPQQLVDLAEERLSTTESPGTIVVCDHNVVAGGLEAREIAKNHNLNVKLGTEATTEFGEIGVKFLSDIECERVMGVKNNSNVFNFLQLKKLIDGIRKEGKSSMLVDLHHPFDSVNKKRGFNFEGILKAGIFKNRAELMAWFDFTEVNGACVNIKETRGALELALRYNIPIVSSDDAHYPDQIGRYYTETDHDDAREAIVDNNDLTIFGPEGIDYRLAKYYRLRAGVRKRVSKLFKWLTKTPSK